MRPEQPTQILVMESAKAEIASEWIISNCDPNTTVWLPGNRILLFSPDNDADLVAFSLAITDQPDWLAIDTDSLIFVGCTGAEEKINQELLSAQEIISNLGIDANKTLHDLTTISLSVPEPAVILAFQTVSGAITIH